MDTLSEEQKKCMMETGQAGLNMSHSIKNMLQAVRSAEEVMDLALEKRDLKRAAQTWNLLKENLDRMQKLVLDTLKLGKDQPLRLQPCPLNRLIQSAAKTVRSQADLRQVTLSLELNEDLESILADPDKMRDAVLNLLINAIEAVEPKTGRVHLRTTLDRCGNQALLHIRDNGPGIEDTDVIFEAFHSTKNNAGAGLGLTIARRVIQQHGGTIEAQSVPGQGTVFTVRLPVRP